MPKTNGSIKRDWDVVVVRLLARALLALGGGVAVAQAVEWLLQKIGVLTGTGATGWYVCRCCGGRGGILDSRVFHRGIPCGSYQHRSVSGDMVFEWERKVFGLGTIDSRLRTLLLLW